MRCRVEQGSPARGFVTRRGGQSARMVKLITHPIYSAVPMPEKHAFPMGKFRVLANYCRDRGWLSADTWVRPEACSLVDLERVHTAGYVTAVLGGLVDPTAQRRAGLPASPELAERSRIAVGGTLATARQALQDGIACHLAGGTHHAMADHGLVIVFSTI